MFELKKPLRPIHPVKSVIFTHLNILLALCFSLISCEQILPKSTKPIGIVVMNNTSHTITSLVVSLIDGDTSGGKIEGTSVNVLKIHEVASSSLQEEMLIALKEFSNTGEGRLSVKAIISNGDSLSTGLGSYKYFRVHTEFRPRSWQTIEVVLTEENNSSLIQARVAKYKNGEFVER